MTDFEPCLSGCDQALAEAQLLLASMAEFPDSLEPELAALRARISTLRHEVERLRGMTTVRVRRKIHPDWIELTRGPTPWPAATNEAPEG
jgi:hypothetical protein